MPGFSSVAIALRILVAASAFLLATPAALFAQGVPSNVWVTDSLVKVQPTASPGLQQSAAISAARNEFQSFQVHVNAAGAPIVLNVAVSDFVSSQTGAVISSATNVTVYREAYMNITTLSDANGTLGLTPDPLIPVKDSYIGETRNAFPFTVPVGQTQSVWIDVLVPDIAGSGSYSATVTLTDNGTTFAQVPVTLTVRNFTLPATSSFRSAYAVSYLGFCKQAYGVDNAYTDCAQYPGSGSSSDRAIDLNHIAVAKLLLDHRMSLGAVPSGEGYPTVSWSLFDTLYGPLLNGTAPTLLAGAKLTSLPYSPPGVGAQPQYVPDWVSHFSDAGWLAGLFHYTCDEPPSTCSWEDLPGLLQSVHNASAQMKPLVTTDLDSATTHGVLNDIDILVPIVNAMDPQGGSNQRSAYDAFLGGANKHLWWYQACPSHGSCSNGTVGPASATWPSYMIDATPVRNRVFQWLTFLNNIEGELYYFADYCWNYTTLCPDPDPWVSQYIFGGNGDGTLIYPGTSAKIGGTTPVPLPSVRLKHIRDGSQDYEYLSILSNAGQDAFARSTAAGFITNSYTFSNDPVALASARTALGDKIEQLVQGGGISSPSLSVTSGSISASGNQGGSFSPTSFQFQVSASSARLGFSITNVPAWLTVSAASGVATTSATTITFTVNGNAKLLAPGTYPATITFTNTTNGFGTTTRSATLTVNVQPGAPANDNFANATTIHLGQSKTANNTNATRQAGEPLITANAGGKSVWWNYLAAQSGPVVVSTSGSNFDTLLGVYTGSAVNALTLIASNNDINPPSDRASIVTFNAVAGKTYHIAVDGFNSGSGAASGNIALVVADASAPGSAIIVAAVAPISRATTVNQAVTAYGAIINASSTTAATTCSLALPASVPATFTYQTIDSNNTPTGSPNTPVNIAPNATQGFYFIVKPTQTMSQEIAIVFKCTNTNPALVYPGINTFTLTAGASIADVIIGTATSPNFGIMDIADPSSSGAFTATALNIGPNATLTFVPTDTGVGQLPSAEPLSLFICQIEPNNAQCINPISPGVSSTVTVNTNQAVYFAVFAIAQGTYIPFDIPNNRVYIQAQQSGTPLAQGSVAVRMGSTGGATSASTALSEGGRPKSASAIGQK